MSKTLRHDVILKVPPETFEPRESDLTFGQHGCLTPPVRLQHLQRSLYTALFNGTIFALNTGLDQASMTENDETRRADLK